VKSDVSSACCASRPVPLVADSPGSRLTIVRSRPARRRRGCLAHAVCWAAAFEPGASYHPIQLRHWAQNDWQITHGAMDSSAASAPSTFLDELPPRPRALDAGGVPRGAEALALRDLGAPELFDYQVLRPRARSRCRSFHRRVNRGRGRRAAGRSFRRRRARRKLIRPAGSCAGAGARRTGRNPQIEASATERAIRGSKFVVLIMADREYALFWNCNHFSVPDTAFRAGAGRSPVFFFHGRLATWSAYLPGITCESSGVEEFRRDGGPPLPRRRGTRAAGTGAHAIPWAAPARVAGVRGHLGSQRDRQRGSRRARSLPQRSPPSPTAYAEQAFDAAARSNRPAQRRDPCSHARKAGGRNARWEGREEDWMPL